MAAYLCFSNYNKSANINSSLERARCRGRKKLLRGKRNFSDVSLITTQGPRFIYVCFLYCRSEEQKGESGNICSKGSKGRGKISRAAGYCFDFLYRFWCNCFDITSVNDFQDSVNPHWLLCVQCYSLRSFSREILPSRLNAGTDGCPSHRTLRRLRAVSYCAS